MDSYHKFVQKDRKQQKQKNADQDKRNKKISQSDQDEDYLMNQIDDQNQNQQEKIKQNCDEQQQQDPLDAFMNTLQQQKNTNIKQKGLKQNMNHKKIGDDQSFKDNREFKLRQNQKFDPQQQMQMIDESQQQQLSRNYHQNLQDKSLNEEQFQNYQNYNDQQQENNIKQQFYDNGYDGQNQEPFKKKQDKKIIQVLKPFDFGTVQLQEFQKDFYEEHEEITNLNQSQIKKIMKQLQIKVYGQEPPKPIISFGHLDLDQKIKKIILKEQFEKPTPIQAQAIPAALSGRDIIGVAKTGSGKTLAYVWPMIIHVGHQRQSDKNEGPIGLILAPTRQLCQQIYLQTKKYAKKFDMKVSCLLGGENKHQQWKTLKTGVDILIASPGRLIQMIKKKATNMLRVTYLVLDEADKMLSLGFQQQIRSIVSQTRQDRQTLLFTATMKKSMQFLAGDILTSPIRILIGQQNTANQDIKQQVVVVNQREQKLTWIQKNIKQLLAQGKILIFCNQKDSCESLSLFIQSNLHLHALTLYGDKAQYERTSVINAFKGDSQILIATDIAGRGLDVKNIKTVINFQCPKNIQTYVHRIGRAGRAGVAGTSISFLSKSQSDIKFSIQLIKIFQNSGYPVVMQLQDLSCLDDLFRRKRLSSKMGVSFAKGKDATKLLNQALKKQQMGFSRAGLGCQQTSSNSGNYKQKKSNYSYGNEPLPQAMSKIMNSMDSQNYSITQMSKILREKMSARQSSLSTNRLNNHFVKSQTMGERKNSDQQDQQSNKKSKVTVSYFTNK